MTSTSLERVLRHACVIIAIVAGLSFFGPTEAIAEPEVAAEASTVDINDVLDTLCAASHDARTGVRSAIATAWFKRWSQSPDEDEPRKMTDGRFQLYIADGKYHLRFKHELMLCRVINPPPGVVLSNQLGEGNVFRDQAGQIVEVPAKLANMKADNVFVVYDEQTITSTVFTPLFRPSGVRTKTLKQFREISPEVGMSLADPASFVGGFCNLEAMLKNLVTDAIQARELPDGGYRVMFPVRNAPKVRVEIDAFAKDGFNISAYRVFNEGQELPASAKEATWKQIDGHWIVTKLTSENRFRGSKDRIYTKEMIGYFSVSVNWWVDPSAFTLNSMNRDWVPRVEE